MPSFEQVGDIVQQVEVWTKFPEDSPQDQEFDHEEKIFPETMSDINHENLHGFSIQELLTSIIGDEQNPVATLIKEPQQIPEIRGQTFWTSKQMIQDKNALKFLGRVFVKYHRRQDKSEKKSTRVNEVREVFETLCGGDQGKIKLSFFKILFKESKFSDINRKILYKILGDPDILSKELHFNGNVKKKGEYMFSCKLMRLRCRSSTLCERAQCR